MTGLSIALVGEDQAGAALARRALAALAPEARISHLPPGLTPATDLDGIWLLAPPPGSDPTVHDLTISWAMHLCLPLVGPLGSGEGESDTLRPVPGGRLAGSLGDAPLQLPATANGARRGAEYLAPAGTLWSAEAHRGAEPAVITAGGAPFVMLVDHPLATDAGLHPLLTGFVAAARAHLAARATTRPGAPGPTRSPFAPLPDEGPLSYVHQMRTSGYRWWRPLLALATGTATFVVLALTLTLVWAVLDPSMLDSAADPAGVDLIAPIPMLMGNLMLAALIPAAIVATRVGHWRPVGALFSVTGRIRWRWLGRAMLVTTLIWGSWLVAMWFIDGGEAGERPQHWPWLLVITLLTTPLQSAGEEVAFRGALMQGVGAWIRRPVLALVVGTVLSAALFALAHTSLDPWILLDLGTLAVAACYLTWRTGGLEAAIALHVVNNLVLILMLTLLGGLEGAYVTEGTTSTFGAAGISAVSTLVMMAILLWQARRVGVAPNRLGAPATSPPELEDARP
ncbi:CPBP family intramembrane glutamic endopeptidase [Janibacter sp. GS2]|uniref:CPBP family intramembrane glutamic endopeptidase n=1 Tax=Janibacter sp. GS2 TaxID=3442646 RepID=UPI003EB96DF0